MMSLSKNSISIFLTSLAFSSFVHAQATNSSPHAYAAFTAGYGTFQDTSAGTGDTTVARIAIGSLYEFNQNAAFGGEIGVQSGNHMMLSNDVAAAFGYTSAAPLYLTVKPPVDFLAVLRCHFNAPVFVQVKTGAVYLRTMTDAISIPSESKWLPEVQVGAGFDLTCRTRMVLSYQRFFGQSPTLENVNSVTGTANLDHVPTWQAGMISFETDL